MNHKKDPRIVSLRALRKASHLSGKLSKKSSHFFDRVENKTSRIIINQAGSMDGSGSIGLGQLLSHAFPQMDPIHPALPQIGQRPSVTVFAFLDPKGFYGGIATLLITAATLANKLGYDLRIAQTTGYSKRTPVLEFLASNGINIPKERFSTLDVSDRNPYKFAYLPLHPDDVVVVSAWWDAQIAAQLPLSKKFLYLIQDYEPIFYNNGDLQLFADQTYYSEKFIPLCNTELLYSFFKENDYAYIIKNARWFEPAPAPQVKPKPATTENGPRKLFLYGRPNVHRNLFYSALQALEIAFSNERLRKQNWELYSAGSVDVPSVRLGSGHIIKNLGKMNLDEYYAWTQTIDVAVSPMLAPHPNYPTLELAAMGAMVVSTKWRTKQSLDRYSKNILMADPTPQSMAQKIIDAALTDEQVRRENQSQNNINTNWTEALEKPLNALAAYYKKA